MNVVARKNLFLELGRERFQPQKKVPINLGEKLFFFEPFFHFVWIVGAVVIVVAVVVAIAEILDCDNVFFKISQILRSTLKIHR